MEEYMPFVWISIAVVMAVGEAATNQLVSIWFVVGALCAAVSSLITSSVLVQVIVFIVVTCGTLIATKPLVDKYKKGHKEVKTNSDRFIGQTGVMLTDIDTLETVGQVKVSGEVWTAKLKNPTPVKKDDKVKILAIEGVKMIVEPWQGE